MIKKTMLAMTIFLGITLAVNVNVVYAQALGKLPGLGSNDFVKLSDSNNFIFATPGIKFRWLGDDEYAVAAYDTLWHAVSYAQFAYDSVIEGPGGFAAIKIWNRWSTMFGETNMYQFKHPLQKKFAVLICPTEQPCFVLGANPADSASLLSDVDKLYNAWSQVASKRDKYKPIQK